MIKARSRDFLLMICGVLLMIISLVTIILSVATKVSVISSYENRKKVLENVAVVAQRVVVSGHGNFIKSGPRYDALTISDVNVKFKTKNDKVRYALRLCNKNSEDVVVDKITNGNMICSDSDGNELDCGNVRISKKFTNSGLEIVSGTLLEAQTCMVADIEITYLGDNRDDELNVHIDQFSFNIDVVEK